MRLSEKYSLLQSKTAVYISKLCIVTALERNEIKRQYHFQKLHLKSELHFEVFDPSLDSSVALVFMLCNTLKGGRANAPPVFGRSVNPNRTRRAHYVHRIIFTTVPSDFCTVRRLCYTSILVGL